MDKIKSACQELINNIHKEIVVFDNHESYNFVFPDSKFEDVEPGKRNNITYEQKIIAHEEDTFKDRLNHTQIEQIAEKGEF